MRKLGGKVHPPVILAVIGLAAAAAGCVTGGDRTTGAHRPLDFRDQVRREIRGKLPSPGKGIDRRNTAAKTNSGYSGPAGRIDRLPASDDLANHSPALVPSSSFPKGKVLDPDGRKGYRPSEDQLRVPLSGGSQIVRPAAHSERADSRPSDSTRFANSSSIQPAGPSRSLSMDPLDVSGSFQPPGVITQPESADRPPDRPPPLPIDLSTALELAAGQNPQVGFAQQRIQEAYAQLTAAEALWLPSLRAGVNYNKHDGVIQNVEGDMVSNSRSSLYSGLGAQAVGAGSPAIPGVWMSYHLGDALFQPRIAQQLVGARQQASAGTINDTLLEAAIAYMDLLEATQIQAVSRQSLADAEHLRELTQAFAESGQGLQADADRAVTELSVQQIEVQRAEESVRVASVRLGRILSQQDMSQLLVPQESVLIPLELVSPSLPLSDLLATGLSTRPELAESQHLVRMAVEQLRRECLAPRLPSVLLGFSYGGNGGSPTSTITDFGDRVDFDAAAFWEVRNLGLGEQAARSQSRARLEQARWRQVEVMDQVASEVAEAFARVEARRSQIQLARAGVRSAEDSYRRNSERIRDGQGLPIEALQSMQALDQARRQLVRAVADFNRAQFQLQRALGWPIQ